MRTKPTWLKIIKFYIYVVLGFLGNKEPRIVNMDHVSY